MSAAILLLNSIYRSGRSGERRLCARRRGALPEQNQEALLRHRLGEQVALAEVAAHAEQRVCVAGLLDADRHGGRVEIVREVDDGAADRGPALVGATVGDEAAIE